MNLSLITIIVLVVLSLPALVRYLIQRVILKQLAFDLQMRLYDTFFSLLARRISRVVIPSFSREYMKLQAYSLIGDDSHLEVQFSRLLKMPMMPRQNQEVTKRAFSYYAQKGDQANALPLLKRIKTFKDKQMIHDCEMMYSIYVLKESKYIQELEAKLTNDGTLENAATHYMLAVQYGYLGNSSQRDKHLALAKSLITANGQDAKTLTV